MTILLVEILVHQASYLQLPRAVQHSLLVEENDDVDCSWQICFPEIWYGASDSLELGKHVQSKAPGLQQKLRHEPSARRLRRHCWLPSDSSYRLLACRAPLHVQQLPELPRPIFELVEQAFLEYFEVEQQQPVLRFVAEHVLDVVEVVWKIAHQQLACLRGQKSG